MTTAPKVQIGDQEVRRIGFGALRLLGTGGFGPPADEAAAEATLRRAAATVDVIDTADCYGPKFSEAMIAKALHPYRPGLIVATKGGLTCPTRGRWIPSAAPDRLRRCCEQSLRRLKLDQHHLYQLHAVDPSVPFEQSVHTLVQLRDEGLIRHVGLCNITTNQLRRAQAMLPVASVQNRFSLADQGAESLLEICEAESIPFLAWFPLQRGALTTATSGMLADVASRHRATTAQVALAWLLARSPVVLPIPGTSSVRHLDENLGAGQLVLGSDAFLELKAHFLARGSV